jgi:ribonuclease E
MPLEEAIKQATQQEAAKPRQEAAIKGISPDQPAPNLPEKVEAPVVVVAPQEPGLFSKIFSWFRAPAKPDEPVVAAEPAKKPRESRNDNRRDRDGRRGGRNANKREEERGERNKERGNRNERNAEKAPTEEASAGNSERQERRPRGERKPRGERQPAEAVESKLNPQAVGADQSATIAPLVGTDATDANGGDDQGNRRRGRRGGRGRGDRRNEGEATTAVAQSAEHPAPESVVAIVSQEPVVVVVPAVVPVAESAPAESVASIETATLVLEPAPVVEATPAAEPAPIAAALVADPAPVDTSTVNTEISPKIEEISPAVATTEPIDIASALAESGLVLVQTSAAAPAVAPVEAPVKLGRPRKPKTTQAEGEPLLMVETGK